MAGSVTVKDVARKAQVSIGTVSRVFNNHENVTEEMRLRVMEAAAQLGYFSSAGKEARPTESSRAVKEVGFLFCALQGQAIVTNPFWSYILHGAESEASKAKIRLTYRSIGDLQHNQDTLLTTIYDMKVGGILLVGPAEGETVRLLQETGIPLMLVDNYVPGVNAVVGDNFNGAKMAVEYLIHKGHRQIALIDGPVLGGEGRSAVNKIYTIEQRARGYRMALLDAELPVPYELQSAGDLTADGGYAACQRLLQRGVPFSAIFCINDETAIGAMKALREAGRQIPEDVSLIGFDDIDLVEHLSPALSTVCVNKEALGSVAFKRLLSLIQTPDPTAVLSVLDVELIERTSVALIPS